MSGLCVSHLNQLLESGQDLPEDVWDRWLWHTDAAELATKDCLLNEMHLLGLIIARYRALREPKLADHVLNIPLITHLRSRVYSLSPRQLRDVVEDLQMHWGAYIEDKSLADELADTVDACMARFGEINLKATQCDDVTMAESNGPPIRLSQSCIRRFVSIFFVLYRHLHAFHNCVRPAAVDHAIPQIEEFHLQAGQETFNRYTMYMDLPPAARLIYRQDFAGYYNCISQVVYFHFPSYERRVQQPLDTVRAEQHPANTLAPLLEMYPDIKLIYEDEQLSDECWQWVVMGARVYLVSPRKEFFYSDDLRVLVGLVLLGGRVGVLLETGEDALHVPG
jgi:hypothetical protein